MVDQFQSQNFQQTSGQPNKNRSIQDDDLLDGEMQEEHGDDSKPGSLFSSQKEKLLSEIDAFSTVIKSTTDELRKDGATSVIADYAEKLGGQMGDVKQWVNDLNVESAMQSTRQFARRRPEVVLLGMFGAGLIAGRFLKSSSGTIGTSDSSKQQQVRGFPSTSSEVH